MTFVNPLQHEIPGDAETKYPVMWRNEASELHAMLSEPDSRTVPKKGNENRVARLLWPKASRLLVPYHLDTIAVRVSAIYMTEPSVGAAWHPVTPLECVSEPEDALKAWCAYLNSTVGALFFLGKRAGKLTYARYATPTMDAFPVPDPLKCDIAPLVQAFNATRTSDMLRWAQMDSDPVRHYLDDAVADVIGLDPAEIADWRMRIVLEPTVSGNVAPINER